MNNLGYYRTRAGAAIAVWFGLSLIASALGIFQFGSKYAAFPPLPLGLAVTLPILAFAAWYGLSPGFRDFTRNLDVRTLTILQSWRLGGFVFLVLYSNGLLPGTFALPAGWGDMTVGATAWLAATYLTEERGRKAPFILWQLLGVTDLVSAITLGVLSSKGPLGLLAHGVTADVMTTLPLSLIPTFVVPLLLIVHFISIAQARRWRTGSNHLPIGSGYAPAAQAPGQ